MAARNWVAITGLCVFVLGCLCSSDDVTMMPASITLATLKNASVMVCSDINDMPLARMVEMTDELMRSYFESMGGDYVRDYMAGTQEEALENFPNMLLITTPISMAGKDPSFTVLDNILAKQIIVEDLEKLVAYLKRNNTTVTNGSGQTSLDKPPPSTERKDLTGHYRTPEAHSTTTGIKIPTVAMHIPTIPLKSNPLTSTSSSVFSTSSLTTPSNSSSALVTPSILRTVLTPASLRTRAKTPTPRPYNIPSPNQQTPPLPSVTHDPTTDSATTTVDPDVANGLDQLKQYVEGSQIVKRDLSALWREANTSLDPSLLLGLVHGGGRVKRKADGTVSREEYCQSKGSPTEDGGYIRLCSLCAATTQLPEGHYPRYINEVICKTGDSDCFTVGGTAHGQCKQTHFSMNMMKKKKGQCQMMLHGGETLVFEDWELVPTRIRVACECTINKLSVFSSYVGQADVVG